MAVDTKHVTGRRDLCFASLDDVLADAQQCVEEGYKTLGNWPLGKILDHLAQGIDVSIDNERITTPWLVRLLMRPIARRMLRTGFSPGFQLSKQHAEIFIPEHERLPSEGLAHLESSIRRFRSETPRGIHPAFGKLAPEELDLLHRRHAELHLSFAVPAT